MLSFLLFAAFIVDVADGVVVVVVVVVLILL